MIRLDVTPTDAAGLPVPAPIVTLFSYDARGLPCPIEPAIRAQTNFYHSEHHYAPKDPTGEHYVAPFTLYGTATGTGFALGYFGPLPWDGKKSLTIPVPLVPFV